MRIKMKFLKLLMSWIEKRAEKRSNWNIWFAWYPVFLTYSKDKNGVGDLVWFAKVYRRRGICWLYNDHNPDK